MPELNTQTEPSNGGTGCGASFEPCSCCRALAMVRMPAASPDAAGEFVPPRASHREAKPSYAFNFLGLKIKQRNNGRHKKEEPPAHESEPGKAGAETWEEDLAVPKKRRLWQGWEGLAVCLFGILLPIFLFTMSCITVPKRITLVILNHPIETIVELALLSLIPLMNWRVWSSFCKNNPRFSLRRGIALGAAIGSSLMIIAVSVAAMFTDNGALESDIGTNFLAGFCWLAILGLAAGASSVYLLLRLRATREFSKSKAQVLTLGAAGAVLAILAFVGAEAKPFYIRYAEKMALASREEDRQTGLAMLRQLYPEQELRLECSDARAAGLSGLFIPIKTSAQRQLYFTLTGQPYSFREFNNTNLASMPDDYVTHNFVGEKVEGLSLIRSSMEGELHPDILSCTINWTYVFKNNSSASQTARAQLVLPPGAVIHGLTWWKQGEEITSSFDEKSNNMAYSSRQADGTVIKAEDLGHGRMVLSCNPVSPDQELRMRVTLVSPLKAEDQTGAKLVLPKFLATNFDLAGDHHLKLHSTQILKCSAIKSNGGNLLVGTLDKESLESAVVVTTSRSGSSKTIAVLDKIATDRAENEKRQEIENKITQQKEDAEKSDGQIQIVIDGSKSVQRQLEDVNRVMEQKAAARRKHPIVRISEKRYVVEKIQQLVAKAPDNLVVVLDGSSSIKPFVEKISDAVSKIPSNIHTTFLLARSEGKEQKFMSMRECLSVLEKGEFAGGQDNLPAVVKAAQSAGASTNGAVLWIHGPQPIMNEEIYIMDSYVAKPNFFELSLGSGATDTYEYFKNHPAIGPFSDITRETKDVAQDLGVFFSKWRPHTQIYEVAYTVEKKAPNNIATLTDQEKEEIITLHANELVNEELRDRNASEAVALSTSYEVVTPVSSAVIHNDWVPQLQGATNGTIGPQGVEAAEVSGVNTAGTVRVNNLANLEALLNIIANMMEIGCGLVGVIVLLNGLTNREAVTEFMGHEIELEPGMRIALGAMLIIVGLSFPGMINWFVASARDANMFS